MHHMTVSAHPSAVGKAALSLDVGLLGATHRILTGFLAIPLITRFTGPQPSFLALSVCLIAMLAAVRGGALVGRQALPFSRTVRAIWFERRQVAKSHDSYQWKKLFWVGSGLFAYLAWSGQFPVEEVLVSSVFLLAGLLGMIKWHTADPRIKAKATSLTQAGA
jgi:hypothetical protein